MKNVRSLILLFLRSRNPSRRGKIQIVQVSYRKFILAAIITAPSSATVGRQFSQRKELRPLAFNMSEKRKPTTRYQGERPPKRRHLSPSSPPPVPKQPSHRQLANPPKEKLPVKLKETHALPTQEKRQIIDLSNHEYQNIAERFAQSQSGVQRT